MRYLSQIGLAVVVLLSASSLSSGQSLAASVDQREHSANTGTRVVVPGQTGQEAWGPKVQSLEPGSSLVIVLATGERRKYRFTSAGLDSLQLVSPSGQPETLHKSRVSQVLRRFNDRTGNGIAIGALIGASAALAAIAIEKQRCGPTCNTPSNEGGMAAAVIAMYAGAGALAGWLVDKIHKGTELLFPWLPSR